MCLAIPARIEAIDDDNLALTDILGVKRQVSVDLTPQARVGDYVLVHAGFAIEVVSPEFAQETLDLIKQFPELADDLTAASDGLAEGADGSRLQGEAGNLSAAGLATGASQGVQRADVLA